MLTLSDEGYGMRPDIAVLILTGNIGSRRRGPGPRSRGRELVIKPSDIEELDRALGRLSEREKTRA